MSGNILYIFNEPSGMYFENYDGIKIFRPRTSANLHIRFEAAKHLRIKYKQGVYTTSVDINQILQHQFQFYETKLSQLLPQLASRDFLEFLLYQFDCSTEIENLFRKGKLSHEQGQRWKELQPTFRRAIKYMAECIVQFQPGEEPIVSGEQLLSLVEAAWRCAEELVQMYILSDQTYYLFPNDTVFTIFPPGEELYYSHEIKKDYYSDLQKRKVSDVKNRSRFVPGPSFVFDLKRHDQILGNAFNELVGTSYLTAINFLRQIIQNCKPTPGEFPIPFMHREETIKVFAEQFKISVPVASKIIDGFSITKQKLESEDPKVFKPKREYRAYRRALFQMPHSTGEHFAFSASMANENFTLLIKESIFGHFPSEWLNQNVKSALGKLSNEAGSWFEKIVADNLKQLGFFGSGFKDSIGIGSDQIQIPAEVGQIDYLGYLPSESLLLAAEYKLVDDSFEPKYFRDELQDFIYSDNAHIKQLRRKSDWVRANLNLICKALSSCNHIRTTVRPQKVAGAIITLLPAFATYFINDYPCVSITELRMNFEKSGHWPYNIGVLQN
jgi:hypothetical protein